LEVHVTVDVAGSRLPAVENHPADLGQRGLVSAGLRGTPSRRGRLLTASIAGLGAALLAVGVYLPWLSFYAGLVGLSGSGSRNGDLLLAGAAAATVAAGAVGLAGGGRPRAASTGRWALTVLGAVLVAFCGYLILEVHRAVDGGGGMLLARSGPGLLVSMAGALLVFATTFLPGERLTVRRGRWGVRLRGSVAAAVGAARRASVADRLRIVLGLLWLVDAALQFQPFMFGAGFADHVLRPATQASPLPAGWAVQLLSSHPALFNEMFAVTQLLIAAGILYRRTSRIALLASIGWALAVWWVGEGLGGLFSSGASPVAGVPGAALLYGVIAALLLLHMRLPQRAGHIAAGVVAALGVLFATELMASVRTSHGLAGTLRAMASGEPGWLAGFDRWTARLVEQHPQATLSGYAVVWLFVAGTAAVIALMNRRAAGRAGPGGAASVEARLLTALAVLVAIAALPLWLLQNLGGIATGTATDVNTAPLIVVLAACGWLGVRFPWPLRPPPTVPI
jgi:hypothetical protein